MKIKDILRNKKTEEKYNNKGIAGKNKTKGNYDASKFRKVKDKKEKNEEKVEEIENKEEK